MGEKRKEIKNLRFLGRRFFEVVDGLPFKQFYSGERFTVLRDGQGVAAIREGFQSADDQSGESLCVVLPLEDGGAGIVVEHDVRPAAFRVFEAELQLVGESCRVDLNRVFMGRCRCFCDAGARLLVVFFDLPFVHGSGGDHQLVQHAPEG